MEGNQFQTAGSSGKKSSSSSSSQGTRKSANVSPGTSSSAPKMSAMASVLLRRKVEKSNPGPSSSTSFMDAVNKVAPVRKSFPDDRKNDKKSKLNHSHHHGSRASSSSSKEVHSERRVTKKIEPLPSKPPDGKNTTNNLSKLKILGNRWPKLARACVPHNQFNIKSSTKSSSSKRSRASDSRPSSSLNNNGSNNSRSSSVSVRDYLFKSFNPKDIVKRKLALNSSTSNVCNISEANNPDINRLSCSLSSWPSAPIGHYKKSTKPTPNAGPDEISAQSKNYSIRIAPIAPNPNQSTEDGSKVGDRSQKSLNKANTQRKTSIISASCFESKANIGFKHTTFGNLSTANSVDTHSSSPSKGSIAKLKMLKAKRKAYLKNRANLKTPFVKGKILFRQNKNSVIVKYRLMKIGRERECRLLTALYSERVLERKRRLRKLCTKSETKSTKTKAAQKCFSAVPSTSKSSGKSCSETKPHYSGKLFTKDILSIRQTKLKKRKSIVSKSVRRSCPLRLKTIQCKLRRQLRNKLSPARNLNTARFVKYIFLRNISYSTWSVLKFKVLLLLLRCEAF